MNSKLPCSPFCSPGAARRFSPYRERETGELTQCASLPSSPKRNGELANKTESTAYGVRRVVRSPGCFSSPISSPTTNIAANRKQTLPGLAERYDRGNLDAAVIIINDPVAFPLGSGAQQWAEAF